jgi:hypothetical protein
MGSLEQAVQALTARMTEAFEMLSARDRRDAEENGRRRLRAGEGEEFQDGERLRAFGRPHVKLDFPRFNGEEDPTSWVCRAEQFFRFQGTQEEDKAALASFHLEGEAQLWFQILLREGREIGWTEFKEGVFARFGPTQFYDPFGELTKLQQEGSIRDYQAKFESLLSKIGNLSQSQQVSCFVSGLREEIKADVTAGRPLTLSSAIGLARVYEARNMALGKNVHSDMRRPPLTPLSTIGQPPFPIKRLTPEELKERQEKGLCFKCNDKYGPGHRCKKLFMIEAYLREDGDGDGIAQDAEEVDTPEVSLNAITGKDPTETMKTYGRIGLSTFVVLIDSGSTHNFMGLSLARGLKLQLAEEGGVDVTIASGEKIHSPGKCIQIPVELQGMTFTIDFYILPVEDHEVVLGTQWLRILGPIRWNFETLEMQFKWNKVPIILHGIKGKSGRSKEFKYLYPEAAENSKKMLEQNVKKKEEELGPKVEGQGGNCAKLELFLEDKEVVRGEG